MLRDHAVVAAELPGVGGRPTEDLAPPSRHVLPVLPADPSGEQRRQQLVLLHPVVESLDQALECLAAAGPLVQRRRPLICHGSSVIK